MLAKSAIAAAMLACLPACSNSNGGGIGARSTAAPAFETRQEIEAKSQGLTSVIAHDWTGDGLVDILVSGAISQEIRLLVASSKGVFEADAGPVLSFQDAPFDLVRFDLEGDGDADFACLFRQTPVVRVFRNDGSGRFAQYGADVPAFGQGRGLLAGDFDGDTQMELAVAGTTRVDIFENGAGGFTRRQFLDLGSASDISSLCVAELDRDGFVDLAVTDSARDELRVFAGSNGGFIQSSSLLLSLPGEEPTCVQGGDVTGDGIADLVVALYGSRRLAVFPGNGQGNFQQPTTIEVGGAPFDVQLAKLAGFLEPQLVVSYLDRAAISVVEARGNGGFGPERQYGTIGKPTATHVVDVDDDGSSDVLATSIDGTRLSLLRGGAAGLQASENFDLGDGRPEFVLTGDFNDDGIDDAIVSDPPAGVCHILVGQRNSPRQRMRKVGEFEAGDFPTLLVGGDFDRDGRRDAAISTSTGLRLLLNRSGALPSFVVWPSLNSSAIPVGTGPLFDLAVGRFDGDDIDDIAVADRGGDQISLLFGVDRGLGFRDERRLLPMPGGPLSPIAGDFNGDGATDLAASAFDAGYLRIFTGDGTGRFETLRDERTQPGINYLRKGDLDRDGREEIVASGASIREILVLDFVGTQINTSIYGVGEGPTALLVQDVNSDSRLDVVVSNWSSGDLSILLGDGLGGFTATPAIPAAFRAVSMGSGDFDGDGFLDILIASQFTDRVTLLRSLR